MVQHRIWTDMPTYLG